MPLLSKWFSNVADQGREFNFFHDLQCRSGFGDRIVDLWAAITVARLLQPECLIDVHWDQSGNRYLGFVGAYSTELFSIAGCTFVQQFPRGAVRTRKKQFSDSRLFENCIRQLPSGARQIVLRTGTNWGNTCPDRLHADLTFYGLDRKLPLDRVVDTYRAVARDTKPTTIVRQAIPADIGDRVGIHIRLADKLVSEESPFEMSGDVWRLIEKAGYAEIDHCIDLGEPMFICSDDTGYLGEIVDQVKKSGGNVATACLNPAHANQPGYHALVDFFALSRTRRIIQMTKYSTFSIAAAICGNVRLVNLDPTESAVGNRIDIWRSVLSV